MGVTVILIYLLVISKGVLKRMENTGSTVETNMLFATMNNYLKADTYRIYRCNYGNTKEITSLVLKTEMENKYRDGGRSVVYSWGCELPLIKKDGTIVTNPETFKKNQFIPGSNYLYDVSCASESAILNAGWVEATPKSMYQSAARWWFDEQP